MYTFAAVDTREGRYAQNPDKISGPLESLESLEAQAQVVEAPKRRGWALRFSESRVRS